MIQLPFVIAKSPTLNIRGLIADRKILKDSIIEKCPLILLPVSEDKYIESTLLKKYYFEWNKKYSAIALGYISLINHSYRPNAYFYYDYKNIRLVLKALRDINKGEEILTNYNQDPTDKSPVDDTHLDYNEDIKTNIA